MYVGSVVCGVAHAALMGSAVILGGIVTRMVFGRVDVSGFGHADHPSCCGLVAVVGAGVKNFEAGTLGWYVIFAVL